MTAMDNGPQSGLGEDPKGTAQPISGRRIAGVIVSIVLIGSAVQCRRVSRRYARMVDQWQVAEPMRATVDLSRPGVTESPLVLALRPPRRVSIRLIVDGEQEFRYELLAGLEGKIEVLDEHGEVAATAELPKESISVKPRPGGQPLAQLTGLKARQYTLRLSVIEPAPKLAYRTQVMVARYELLGNEGMTGAVAGLLAIVLGVVACLVAVPTTIGLCRHGWRKRRQRENPTDS